jgi:uncharacterized protein
MTKILLWIAVVFVALFALRLYNIGKTRHRSGASGSGEHRPPGETMVRCARCGVYLPRADAVPGPVGPTCGDPACAKP